MIAELGQFCLVLALLMAGLQGWAGWRGLEILCRRAAWAQFVLTLAAFVALGACFVVTDLSVATVIDNSHTLKPLLYKIAGTWGNHEGSMLLWMVVLSLFGVMMAGGRGVPVTVLAVHGAQGVGFLAFLLFTSSPFRRVEIPPLDGNDLNPLLQDPALAIHPPMLYLGYVGFSAVFSWAVAYLWRPEQSPAQWAAAIRPWVLFAWTALGAGIALGSWWAYYELGWGGFWFWDPVENASLLPWLLGTALLHSVIATQNRGTFARWTVLLAILTYSLSLLGTFLVRSGVLTSVHAFAVDPARGLFILLLLAVYTGGALLLYGLRAGGLRGETGFGPVSRETGFLLNNLLLGTLAATVLIGTLYPLVLAALDAGQISVGPPYFHATFVPLAVPLLVLMGIGPVLPWGQADLGFVLARLKIAAAITAAIAGLIWAIVVNIAPGILAGLALAAWLCMTSIMMVVRRRGRGPGLWSMALAHAGLGLAVAGMIGTTLWVSEKSAVMTPGDSMTIGRYTLTLDSVEAAFGPNYSTLKATITARAAGMEHALTLTPERRHYPVAGTRTTEAAIDQSWHDDLYVVLGQSPSEDSAGQEWVIRASTHPLVPLLWAGFIIMTLGGAIAAAEKLRARR